MTRKPRHPHIHPITVGRRISTPDEPQPGDATPGMDRKLNLSMTAGKGEPPKQSPRVHRPP